MRSHTVLGFGILAFLAALPLASRAQFQPISKEELSMTADSASPGAAAVYLYREETEDDPHAFRTVYARIKVLTEEGKAAAVVHIDFPKTFVYNAAGKNWSRMAGASEVHQRWDPRLVQIRRIGICPMSIILERTLPGIQTLTSGKWR